jgi:hypothetical protein
MISPQAEADSAPLNKYNAVGRVANERLAASFSPMIGLMVAAAMNPADARLCVIKSVVVIFRAIRAMLCVSVMKLSSFELADYTPDAVKIEL